MVKNRESRPRRLNAGKDPRLLRRLLRAKDRMDAASHEAWPVQRLAKVSGVSEAHFARSFKAAFGVPPHRYLLTRRLERANALLRQTDAPIIEIAFETGWTSLGTFGRTFRQVLGASPSELRAREQATPYQLDRAPPCFVSAALLRQRRPAPQSHDRSFGEAAAGPRFYEEGPSNGGPMSQGVGVVGLYARDQDEAVDFYVGKLGFRIHTDVRNGDYRWLTVQHPEQPSLQLGLFKPQAPTLDAETARTVEEIVAKGAMPPLVLVVDDCRAAYDRLSARGVEFTQAPTDRYGAVDASFRDPAGNGWKMIEAQPVAS